jgi:hypothetical protein
MFVQVKAPGTFPNQSKRKEADEQMRERVRHLKHSFETPRIPAVSAFGTRLAFYEYVKATNSITPPAIPADPVSLNDVAPAGRWSYWRMLVLLDCVRRFRMLSLCARVL